MGKGAGTGGEDEGEEDEENVEATSLGHPAHRHDSWQNDQAIIGALHPLGN